MNNRPPHQRAARWQILGEKFLVLSVLALLTMGLFNARGTDDVGTLQAWQRNVFAYGPIEGFKINQGDYPPLMPFILYVTAHFSQQLVLSSFVGLKGSIVLFLCATGLVFWLWTRDLGLTALLYFSLLLNAVVLGYIDVYMTPFLILSLWALALQKTWLFAILFSITCLIKWQPLIIAPFLAVYLLNITRLRDWRQIPFAQLGVQVVLPVVGVLGLCTYLWRSSLLRAFSSALSHKYLSANALNFNWLLTYATRISMPEHYGGLAQDGQVTAFLTTAPFTLVPRVLFAGFYVGALVAFFKKDKTLENLLMYSIIGYLAYFIFNTGVHENHVYPATVLAILLYAKTKRHLPLMLMLIFMLNANMFFFYGIDGSAPGFSRVVGIDVTVLLALLNVVFFLALWTIYVLRPFLRPFVPTTRMEQSL